MDESNIKGLRTLVVSLLAAIDEETTQRLVLTETLREMFPTTFGPTFDKKYQDYTNRQLATSSDSESEAIRLLDALLAELRGKA